MAKLNVVVPAANVIIDGVEYRKVDRSAREGDVVRHDASGYDFLPKGSFYRVFIDGDGDAMVNDEEGDDTIVDDEFTVFEPVTEKPVRLTVGDYAKVIGRQYHNYAKGSVVRIVKDARDPHPYKAEKADGSVGNWLFESEVERATEAEFLEQRQPQRKPVQPEKPEASDEIVVHEGRSYRKVSRKANVGELVISNVDSPPIFCVTKVCGDAVYGGRDGISTWDSNYAVLEPVNPVASVTEVKRNANVGERIRIVNAKVAIGYGNGDVLTVEGTSNSSGVFATTSEGKTCGVWHSEYVVLTEETPKPTKPEPQVGNYVRVTATDEGLDAGTIAKITEDDGSSTWRYRCETMDGEDYDWLDAGDFEVINEEEAEEAAEATRWAAIGREVGEYKAGDVVEITEGRSAAGTKKGDNATVKEPENAAGTGGIRLTQLNPQGINAWVLVKDVKLIVPVEQRFDRR